MTSLGHQKNQTQTPNHKQNSKLNTLMKSEMLLKSKHKKSSYYKLSNYFTTTLTTKVYIPVTLYSPENAQIIFFIFANEKVNINDVNTILKETSKTYATLDNKSYFKYQVPFCVFLEQEQFDPRCNKIAFFTNDVRLKIRQK